MFHLLENNEMERREEKRGEGGMLYKMVEYTVCNLEVVYLRLGVLYLSLFYFTYLSGDQLTLEGPRVHASETGRVTPSF